MLIPADNPYLPALEDQSALSWANPHRQARSIKTRPAHLLREEKLAARSKSTSRLPGVPAAAFFNLNFKLKRPTPPAFVMSCVCILTPIVIAAWPAFSTAVAAAATSLGYSVLDANSAQLEATAAARTGVKLEIANSEVVTGTLGRDQRISVSRDGVVVTFSRDARGRASLCVTGKGRSDEQLRAAGEELSRAVVQSYVYQRLKDEMQAREFVLVEEERQADRSIRLKVRHWEN